MSEGAESTPPALGRLFDLDDQRQSQAQDIVLSLAVDQLTAQCVGQAHQWRAVEGV